MTKHLWRLLGGLFILTVALEACRDENPRVMLLTEFGAIEVEIYESKAPLTAANFLRYVDENRFEGASFYRTVRMDNQTNPVKIEVIQAGLGFSENEKRLPPIAHENTDVTGLFHRDGTLSMARADPGSASSEFFICIGDQPELDYGGKRNPDGQGFAAFGRVIRGMDVVERIQGQPAEGQMLRAPVLIERVKRAE